MTSHASNVLNGVTDAMPLFSGDVQSTTIYLNCLDSLLTRYIQCDSILHCNYTPFLRLLVHIISRVILSHPPTPLSDMFRCRALAARASLRVPRVVARLSSATFSSTAAVNDPAASLLKLSDFSVADLKGKTVFLRADFNVKYSPLPSSGAADAVPAYKVNASSFKRIDETVPTLRHLLDAGARVVVTAHLGDPKPEDLATPASRAKVSLRPVLTALETALGTPGAFGEDCVGPAAAAAAAAVPKEGGYVLFENLRFHKGEKKNDPAFVQALLDAVKPDVYVNDAFGTGTNP